MWMNRTALLFSSRSAAARRARRATFETLEERSPAVGSRPVVISANLPGGIEQFSFVACD